MQQTQDQVLQTYRGEWSDSCRKYTDFRRRVLDWILKASTHFQPRVQRFSNPSAMYVSSKVLNLFLHCFNCSLSNIHSFMLRYTDTQTQTKKTSQKKVKGILVSAQTVMSASPEGHNPSNRNPQDLRMRLRTEGGKQIQCLERNKHDKAPETSDKRLLDGSLKLDLCQLVP